MLQVRQVSGCLFQGKSLCLEVLSVSRVCTGEGGQQFASPTQGLGGTWLLQFEIKVSVPEADLGLKL